MDARRRSGRRGLRLAAVVPFFVIVLLLGTSLVFAPPAAGAATPGAIGGFVSAAGPVSYAPPPSTPVNTTFTVANSSYNLSNEFWGSTVNNEVHMFRGEPESVNATPVRTLVWPGAMAGEDYDPITNTHYDTYSGAPITALSSETQFVQLCEAIHCISIVQVPAEIDDPSFAEEIVNYTEVNLSFHPSYWMIGNEPELWSHWKIPWKEWPSQYTTGPTPTQFGQEVVAYVDAIRHVDNTTPILGLPASGCTCGSWTFAQWISGVLAVTGPMIQAVAFHEYPAGWLGTGTGSLLDFYATLQGAAGIPIRMVQARQAVTSACPTCNVSVFISELGSALSWSTYGQYAAGFSGDLSLAAQLTQAMDYNLTNVDLFATELATLNSWFSPQGYPRPDYGLYTEILGHLGSEAFPVNITGLDHSPYSIDTIALNDGGRRDLLVVNTNITKSISFSPQFAEFNGGAPVQAWYWNGSIHSTNYNNTVWVEPYTPNAVPQSYPDGLPGSYILPPQSLVLFESYPTGAGYVHVSAKGVPAGTPWYASVGPSFYGTTASNLTLLLPSGAYPVSSVAIPLPIGGKELTPSERLAPFVPSPSYVSGPSSNITINFAPQWRVNLTPSPAEGGTITPSVDWWNQSQPLTVSATPTSGYSFVGWSGWGPGSYNGSGRNATVTPTGRIVETARFVVGNEVELWESGLPLGTPWSVTVRSFTTSSNNSTVTVYEPIGTFGYHISPVPGYRILPENGSFIVGSWFTSLEVRFLLITPPGPIFPVTFHLTGLPTSTAVSVTVRGSTFTLGESDLQFQLGSGLYAYRVGYVPGYHVDVQNKTFSVGEAGLEVDIPFVRTIYSATWQAQGVRSGLNWSVVLNGTRVTAASAWVSTSIPNGTYAYSISLPANFSATPRTGTVVIDGFSTSLYLAFSLVEFPTWFAAVGPGVMSPWSVRLGNLTQGSSANQTSFLAPNGSYTWDIHPPAGYYAVPSHGNLTVAGPTPSPVIQFVPVSERPSAALVAALSAGALTVGVWIGVSIFLGFVVLRRLRRRGG